MKEKSLLLILSGWFLILVIFYVKEVRLIPIWIFFSIFFFNWFLRAWEDKK